MDIICEMQNDQMPKWRDQAIDFNTSWTSLPTTNLIPSSVPIYLPKLL